MNQKDNTYSFVKSNNNDQGLLKTSYRATHPSEETYIVKKTLIIDSRQRNCSIYKNPSFYRIELGDVYKNITSVELKGAILPKSSYNIHTSNNKIDFSIGDYVSSFKITEQGSGYTFPPTVIIGTGSGITATGTAIINSQGNVIGIIVGVSGSGYSTSSPPFVSISGPTTRGGRTAKAVANVGTLYTATLRPGQYTIGGNPVPGTNNYPSGLLLEIQNAMNYAVNGGAYNPQSSSPFAVRLVSEYPTLEALATDPTSAEASDTNATMFNRIQFVNVNSDHWEFLFCSGTNIVNSSNSVLGFNISDVNTNYLVPAVNVMGGTLIPAGTAIRSYFDFNLNDDPEYVIMELRADDFNCERIDSVESYDKDSSLNRKFAVLIFDNNSADCLQDLSAGSGGSVQSVNSVNYLQGPLGKGTFWRDTGKVKALKGTDYDSKRISFRPAEGKLSSLTVSFTKFGYRPGGVQQPYSFEGREHTLIFELTAGDLYSKQKD